MRQAGKGRTGLMACSLLLHLGYQKRAVDSIAFYNTARTTDGKGLTVPSQRRYVGYYEAVLSGAAHDRPRTLSAVRVSGAPARYSKLLLTFTNVGAAEARPTVLVINLGGAAAPGEEASAESEYEAAWRFELSADVKIDVTDEHGARLCRLWVHPSLEPRVARFVLAKDKQRSQLDVLENKGALPPGFSLTLLFEGEGAEGSAATAGSAAAAGCAPAAPPLARSNSTRTNGACTDSASASASAPAAGNSSAADAERADAFRTGALAAAVAAAASGDIGGGGAAAEGGSGSTSAKPKAAGDEEDSSGAGLAESIYYDAREGPEPEDFPAWPEDDPNRPITMSGRTAPPPPDPVASISSLDVQ